MTKEMQKHSTDKIQFYDYSRDTIVDQAHFL